MIMRGPGQWYNTMAIRVARFPDPTADERVNRIAYLQSTDQPEWLLILQQVDPTTTVLSCTDYACLYSAILPDDLSWILQDTRPVTSLRVSMVGAKLRVDLTGLSSPITLDSVPQAAPLRQILQSLTACMFSGCKAAEKAERLQTRLEDICCAAGSNSGGAVGGDVASDGKQQQVQRAMAKKSGQSLINPRVKRAKPSGAQFDDS